MRDEIRYPLAYCASGIVGPSVLKLFAFALGRASDWRPSDLNDAIFDVVSIYLLVLPFWVVFSVIAATLRLRHLVVYIFSGAILGVFIGTLYGAFVSGMVFVTDIEDLNFAGRALRILHVSGGMFATAGCIACACYWLVAIRGRPQPSA